jgi:hypothetical protein
MNQVLDRITQPTPRFFKRLRNVGIVLASVAGAVLAAPIALPIAVITAAGYLTVAGGVLTAVSQMTVEGE